MLTIDALYDIVERVAEDLDSTNETAGITIAESIRSAFEIMNYESADPKEAKALVLAELKNVIEKAREAAAQIRKEAR